MNAVPQVSLESDDEALLVRAEQRIELPVPRDGLWAAFGDTPRFSRLVGDTGWQLEAAGTAEPLFLLRGRKQAADGTELRVEVEPHEWIRGRLFAGPRRFVGLPFDEAVLSFEFVTLSPSSTQVTVRTRAHAQTADGVIGAQGFCQELVRRGVSALQRLTLGITAGLPDPYTLQPPPEADAVRQRAARVIEEMAPTASERQVLDRLVEHIALCDPTQLARLRPVTLAAAWGLPSDVVLRTFLRAARAGLVELFWDVLCPSCRGTAVRQSRLDSLQTHSHCIGCAAAYDIDFDRLVEVTFRPPAGLRPCDESLWCQAGPSNSPHVETQLLLQPQVPVHVHLDLPAGTYLIRVQRGQVSGQLQVTPDGPPHAEIVLSDRKDSSEKTPNTWTLRAGGADLTLCLQGADRRLVQIEHSGWIDDLTSAAKLTALQEFRDLYPRTAVAAGQRIRVGRMAFLFSDLKGSTAMFEQLGDGPAYGQVHDHFEFLTDVIREHNGAVVKTIGDAIMAVFTQDAAAVQAALAIQRRLPEFNARRPDARPLVVKLGVHAGPCVVTSANELLDYFGTTVNLAARVQSQSTGGDVVLLSQLLQDPAVAKAVADTPREEYETTLAGLQSRYRLTRLFLPAVPPSLQRS